MTRDQRKVSRKSFPRALQSLMSFFSQTNREQKKRNTQETVDDMQRLQPSAGGNSTRPLPYPLVTRLIIPSRVRAECLLLLSSRSSHGHGHWTASHVDTSASRLPINILIGERGGETARGREGGALLVSDELKLL